MRKIQYLFNSLIDIITAQSGIPMYAVSELYSSCTAITLITYWLLALLSNGELLGECKGRAKLPDIICHAENDSQKNFCLANKLQFSMHPTRHNLITVVLSYESGLLSSSHFMKLQARAALSKR